MALIQWGTETHRGKGRETLAGRWPSTRQGELPGAKPSLSLQEAAAFQTRFHTSSQMPLRFPPLDYSPRLPVLRWCPLKSAHTQLGPPFKALLRCHHLQAGS